MRLRQLTRGTSTAWPPAPIDLPAGRADGALQAVQVQDGHLLLQIRFDGRDHGVRLAWDAPPSPRHLQSVLETHIGKPVDALGDIEVGPFSEFELRARVRGLLETGGIPRDLSFRATRPGSPIILSPTSTQPCRVCGESGTPLDAYPSAGTQPVMSLHARCKAYYLDARRF